MIMLIAFIAVVSVQWIWIKYSMREGEARFTSKVYDVLGKAVNLVEQTNNIRLFNDLKERYTQVEEVISTMNHAQDTISADENSAKNELSFFSFAFSKGGKHEEGQGGNISNTELENTLDKRYSSNSNLKNISYDLEISENLLESLSADLSEDLLKIRKNTFLEKEIGKAFLVVAATSNRKENHHIAEICHAYNVLVNVADSEEESSFIFPSVVRKGDISIGINSGTGSPTVSKHIRKQIEKAIPDYYADIAVFMGKLREYVKANFKEESQRRYILKTAAAEAFAEERVLTQKEIEEIIRQGQK